MKKTKLLFLMLLCLGSIEVWGQGTPMSYTDFVALAGTGKHFGLQAVSTNSATYQKWFGFTSATSRVSTLTTQQLFTLTGTADAAKIQRVSDSKYLSGGGSFADTGMDVKLVNRAAGDCASEFSSAMQISIDNSAGNHYNANSYSFASGTGGWSAYVAYGPYHVATITCKDEQDNTIETFSDVIVSTGYVPAITGYSTTESTGVVADGEYTFTYTELSKITYTLTSVDENGNSVTGGGITYGGTNYTSTFDAPEGLTSSDLDAIIINGYLPGVVSVSGTAVTVTYNKSIKMKSLADAATNENIPTASTLYTTTEATGGIYDFADSKYFGNIENAVLNKTMTLGQDRYVVVAGWVHGKPSSNGCLFSYGAQSDGLKIKINSSGTMDMTTKGVKDYSASSDLGLQAGQWNFVACAFKMAADNTIAWIRYYSTTTNGKYWTKSESSTMKTPSDANQKFAIGNGNNDSAREPFTGTLANITVMMFTSAPNNADIAAIVGDAPTYNGYEVTYNYKYNGKSVGSETLPAEGGARPEPTFPDFPYGTWTADLSAVPSTISATASYDVNVTYSGPFSFSESHANATWYTIKMRNGYIGYDGTNFPEATSDTQPSEAKNLFAFVGDPFAFKIMSANEKYIANTGDNNALSTLDATGTEFYLKKNSNNEYVFTIDGKTGAVNDISKKMGFWASGAAYIDGGSKLTIDESSAGYVYNIEFADGTPSTGGLTYDATTILASDIMPAFTADAELALSNVTAVEVSGYDANITLSGHTFTVTYTTSKSEEWVTLNELITTATTKSSSLPTGPWGTDPGYYNQTAVNGFSDAISTAQGVLDASYGTTEEANTAYANAATTLQAAIDATEMIMPVVGKTYQLISAYTEFESKQSVKKAMYSDGSDLQWTTVDNTDKSFFWEVTNVDGTNITFRNLNDSKYPAKQTSWNTTVPVSTTEDYCLITSLGEGQFKIKSNGSLSYLHSGSHGSGSNISGTIMVWDTDANGCSAWYIHEAEVATTAYITYVFKQGDEKVGEKTITAAVGDPYPHIADNPFGSITGGYPEENITGDNTVELSCTLNDNYHCYADVASVETWYALDVHSNNGSYTVYNNTHDASNVGIYSSTPDYLHGAVINDNFAWAFIGNPFTGIKLYNRNAEKYITAATDGATATWSDGSANATFQVLSTNGNIENSFALKIDGYKNYLNHQGSALKGWGSNDEGSSFRAYPINDAAYSLEYTFGAQYGTVIIPAYSAIPEGVTVYTCSSIADNGVLTLTEETSMIKANTPYILHKEDGTGSVTLSNDFSTGNYTEAVKVGLLTGVLTSTLAPVDSYVLLNRNSKLGFYHVSEGNQPTVGANRCYMTKSDSEAKAFFFDEATAIEALEALTNGEAKIYDLNGRELKSLRKGINIVGGKKILVK